MDSVMNDSRANWFQTMLNTIKQLVIDPGAVAREFNQSNVQRYFHPLLFVLIWAGLNCLTAKLLQVAYGQLDPATDIEQREIMQFILRYGMVLWPLCVPAMALAPFLVYQNIESRFRNHLVVLCYISGFNLMINIPSFFIVAIWEQTDKARDVFGAVVPFLYCIYFYQSYFKSAYWKSILAALLTILFLSISWFIILAIVSQLI
jgi:hypothetical protein